MPRQPIINQEKACEQFQNDIIRLISIAGDGAKLATELGFSEQAVSAYKRGRFQSLPSLDILIPVMKLLGFDSLDVYLTHLQGGLDKKMDAIEKRGDWLSLRAQLGDMNSDELIRVMNLATEELANR